MVKVPRTFTLDFRLQHFSKNITTMPTVMKRSHQLFLQAFMSRGILNAADVFSLHKTAREAIGESISDDEKREKLIEFVGVINANLKGFGMEIKRGIDEVDGSGYYGLVNTTESNITLCASQFTDNELEFFKKLIEMIMTSDTGTLGSIAAVNVTDSLSKKMGKNEAEQLLERLVSAKWIDKTGGGKYYLSTRAILELEQYILDMYPDTAIRCNMCKKLAVQGQTCGECDAKLHNYCSEKFFKNGSDRKCPVCRSPWNANCSTPQPSVSGTQHRKRKSGTEEDVDEIPDKRSGTQSRRR